VLLMIAVGYGLGRVVTVECDSVGLTVCRVGVGQTNVGRPASRELIGERREINNAVGARIYVWTVRGWRRRESKEKGCVWVNECPEYVCAQSICRKEVKGRGERGRDRTSPRVSSGQTWTGHELVEIAGRRSQAGDCGERSDKKE
jgi:hypothetical protein